MASLSQLRHRAFAILDGCDESKRIGLIAHGALVSVIALSLCATVAESVPSLSATYRGYMTGIEWLAAIVLSFEMAIRVWTAVEHPRFRADRNAVARLRYVCSGAGLVDLMAIAPFWLGSLVSNDLKILLVLRFLRFLKLTQYSAATRALLDSLFRERRALGGCLILILGAALISAALMHYAEHQAQPDKFGTIPEALWWSIVTLGTVGYGDAVPVTVLGRTIASLTIFCGLLMVALPIGIVASSFADEVHRRDFLVTWGLIARIPLFSTLSAAEVAEVMTVLRATKVDAGAVVTRRGDPAHSMFLVVDGEVELKLKDQLVRLTSGHFFGEVAVLRKTKRSATAIAVAATRLLVLDASDLHSLMERQPGLAERITKAAHDKLGQSLTEEADDLSPNEYLTLSP